MSDQILERLDEIDAWVGWSPIVQAVTDALREVLNLFPVSSVTGEPLGQFVSEQQVREVIATALEEIE